MSDKDTIYRQDAIDLFPNDTLECDTKGGYIAPHLAREMIEELPSAQPDIQKMQDLEQAEIQKAYELGKLDAMEEMPHWTPCSERLPEDGRVVLWCNEHGSVFTTAITARKGESWAVGKRHRLSKIIAWMPLPKPYKEERKE